MNVKVELENGCPDHWVPPREDIETWLNRASSCVACAGRQSTVSIRVVDETESARLNLQYRGKQYSTNVLSFSCDLPDTVRDSLDTVPLGDLAICAPVLDSEARHQGKSLESHWAHLTTHGFLHLHGYRHDTEARAENMESMEIKILQSLGFNNPYQPS